MRRDSSDSQPNHQETPASPTELLPEGCERVGSNSSVDTYVSTPGRTNTPTSEVIRQANGSLPAKTVAPKLPAITGFRETFAVAVFSPQPRTHQKRSLSAAKTPDDCTLALSVVLARFSFCPGCGA